MELRWYGPKVVDTQTPHDRDELYVVEERVPFRAGDALFVPANQPHRFESFTPDLALWVIFYGPVGGEMG